MAEAFIKYDLFKDELMKGGHGNFSTPPALKVMLSNTDADVATTKSPCTYAGVSAGQPTGTGYTAGGESATAAYAYGAPNGTVTISGTAITWTAGSGGITSFKHAILYNDSHASKGLIGAWTRAAGAVVLAQSETFTLKFNSLTGSQPMFTVA